MFGLRKEDYENANLMILLSYIILGHSDWKNGEIKIFATFPKEEFKARRRKFNRTY